MKEIVFVGNPNSGKSTLFNSLSGGNARIANWHGVTVDVLKKNKKIKSEQLTFFDLPGMYSLNTRSEEEVVAKNFIEEHRDAIFCNVCAYETIERSLHLTYELIKLGIKVVLIINTMGGAFSSNKIDTIKKLLNIPVFQIDARKKNKGLVEQIVEFKTYVEQQIIEFDELIKKFPMPDKKTEAKIERFLLSKFYGTIIFVCVMAVIFWITFGPVGSIISKFISNSCLFLCDKFEIFLLNKNLLWFSDFFEFVFEKGFVGVLAFLPQLVILLTLLWVLEEIGYIPRLAYIFNDFLSRYKISGRAIFSLIMGACCTTSAVYTSRNMESRSQRFRASVLLPFISCSAKLPIFVFICSFFFSKYKVLISLGLYLVGILVGLLILRILPHKDDKTPFILELPSLKRPSISRVLKEAFKTMKEYFVRVGIIVVFVSTIIWLLQSFDFSFNYVGSNSTNNILIYLAQKISVIFIPLGFGNWQSVVALVTGLVAKESVAVSFFILDITNLFNAISSLSFLLFVLFYSPCVSALSAIRKEFGFFRALLVFLYHNLIAYLVAFVFYTLLSVFDIEFLLLICAILIIGKIFFKIIAKNQCKKCGQKCNKII